MGEVIGLDVDSDNFVGMEFEECEKAGKSKKKMKLAYVGEMKEKMVAKENIDDEGEVPNKELEWRDGSVKDEVRRQDIVTVNVVGQDMQKLCRGLIGRTEIFAGENVKSPSDRQATVEMHEEEKMMIEMNSNSDKAGIEMFRFQAVACDIEDVKFGGEIEKLKNKVELKYDNESKEKLDSERNVMMVTLKNVGLDEKSKGNAVLFKVEIDDRGGEVSIEIEERCQSWVSWYRRTSRPLAPSDGQEWGCVRWDSPDKEYDVVY